MKPRTIVPFDFSATAEQALAWAIDLQKTTGAEPIQIIHAIDSRPPAQNELLLATSVVPNEDEIAGLERSLLEAAARLGGQASAKVIVGPAPVGAIIADVAHEGSADLIVMGTHGRTGIRRLVLGSVAEHVLRHASCPVVTVRGVQPAVH